MGKVAKAVVLNVVIAGHLFIVRTDPHPEIQHSTNKVEGEMRLDTLCALLCSFFILIPVGNVFSDFVDDVERFNGPELDTATWETRFVSPGETVSQNDILQMSTGLGDFAVSSRNVTVFPGQTVTALVELTNDGSGLTLATLMLSTKDGQFGVSGDLFRLFAEINGNNTIRSFVNGAPETMVSTPVLGNRFRLEIRRITPTLTVFIAFDENDQLVGSSVRAHEPVTTPLFVSMVTRGGTAVYDDLTIPNIGPVDVSLDSIDIERGIMTGTGVVIDTIASDDKFVQFDPGFTLSNEEAPVRVILDTAVPIEAPLTFGMNYESSANTPGLEQTLELMNWNTGEYEVLDVRALTLVDQQQDFDLDAGISDFIQRDTRRIAARVQVRQTGFTILFPWSARIDFVNYVLN